MLSKKQSEHNRPTHSNQTLIAWYSHKCKNSTVTTIQSRAPMACDRVLEGKAFFNRLYRSVDWSPNQGQVPSSLNCDHFLSIRHDTGDLAIGVLTRPRHGLSSVLKRRLIFICCKTVIFAHIYIKITPPPIGDATVVLHYAKPTLLTFL